MLRDSRFSRPGSGKGYVAVAAGLMLAVALLGLAASPGWAQNAASPSAKEATAPEPPRDWQVILATHQQTLVQQALRVKSMAALQKANLRRFRANLSLLQGKLDELELIISLSGGNPWELRAVLNDMLRIRQAAQTLIAPFRKARDELQQIANKLDALKVEFTKRQRDNPGPDVAAAIAYYLRYLSGTKSGLGGSRSVLDRELGPADDLLRDLDKDEKELRQQLPKAWKAYYFTPWPKLFAWNGWLESPSRLLRWGRTNATIVRSLSQGADAELTLSVLTKAIVGLLLLLAVDLLAPRRLRLWFPNLGGLVQLRRVWRLAGLGVILHWVSLGAPLLLHEALSGLSEMLLGAAFAVFSWFLVQVAGLVPATGAHNPLRRLWIMFSLGLALQIINLPEPLLTGLWLALLLGFLWIARRAVGRDVGPLRLAGRVTPSVGVALVVMVFLGWQHLSVLLFAGWFLVLAAIQMGAGLAKLVSDWQVRAGRGKASLVTQGLVSGLGEPVIFLSLFFVVLYWFATELGGRELFFEAVGFTVTMGSVHLTLGSLALILTGFYLTRSARVVVHSLVRDLPRRRPDIDPGVPDVLDTTAKYLLWGGYALLSLFLLGFSFTSLAVVAGGLSVGIGFGLQAIVNNFLAGLILLFGRSIQAGDTVQIDGTWGQVTKVNIRNTVVQTFDNATLFVPNSNLVSGKLVNWSHRDPSVRREIVVGVAYGSDIELVRTILLETAAEHPRVMRQPAPSVLFLDFGESSLDFKLLFWVDDVSVGLSATSDIRFALDRRFRQASINIPFPQRDVRLVTAPTPAPAPDAASSAPDDGQATDGPGRP